MATATGAMESVVRLLNAQNEHFIDGGRAPWSSDRPRNLKAVDMFLQGRNSAHTLSALTDIVSLFNPEITSSGGPKAPGAPHQAGVGGELVRMRSALSEFEWGKTISWHEIAGQVGDPTGPGYTQKIYDLHEKTNQDLIVGAVRDLERYLFAVVKPEMFTGNADGSFPLKSVFTGANVWTTAHYDGTGAAGDGADGLVPGMTDQQSLDPTLPKFARYDALGGATQLSATKLSYDAAGDATLGMGHIINRMQELIELLNWEPVPLASGYAEGMNVSPKVILCSREAQTLMRTTFRAHNDFYTLLAPVGDAAQTNTQFNGIPLMTSDTLRSAAIYPDVQRTSGLDVDGAANRYIANDYTGVTEFDTEGAAGGYYYFFDTDSVNLHLHGERAFTVGDWKSMAPVNEDLYRRLIKMIGNLHFSRFETTGILHPAANISGYTQST